MHIKATQSQSKPLETDLEERGQWGDQGVGGQIKLVQGTLRTG